MRGMQFVWPIKADYRIVWLAEDYSQTVIARQKRDYLWIMARTPQISAADLEKRIAYAILLGYDPALIRKVPQRSNGEDIRTQAAGRHLGDCRPGVVIRRGPTGLAAHWCAVCARFP
jgi:hypothetical protein